MVKRCKRCCKDLDVINFSIKKVVDGKIEYQSMCKECNREYQREHYQNNKDVYKRKARLYDEKVRKDQVQRLLEYFSTHPCVDCGESDPLVLEFDHRNNKTKGIAEMLGDYPWHKVEAEIKKCDVRCANCHRRKTAKERNFYMYKILQMVS